MGSYMQLLLEALRSHLKNNGRNEARSFTEDDVGHFTGLILEDLRVDTSFTINDMDREMNPLFKLLYGEGKSQFRINRLQDHMARIEMKVQQLESRVPRRIEQNILVAAAEVDDDESYEDEESDTNSKKKNTGKSGTTASATSSEDSKSKGQKKSDRKGKTQKGKCDGEKKNCFARLFFSKCWSGNQGSNAGWNAICCNKPGKVRKGACPAYSTCPCGDDAPCAKIEKKPCPANDKKRGGGKGKSGGGGDKEKSGGKGKSGGGSKEKSKGNKEKGEKKNKDENPLSALCDKFCKSPCIFSKKTDECGENKSTWRCGSCKRKKHVHTPCCCRCKDNPALEENKKSKGGKKGDQKPKGGQKSANKAEPKKEAPKKKENSKKSSVSSDEEYEDAEEQSVHSAIILPRMEDGDPTQEPIRCVGCTDCDDIRLASREPTEGMNQTIKGQTKATLTEFAVKGQVSRRQKGEIKVIPKKSSTTFQALLPPSISSESTSHNMVSHQILKTLSTIHGPIRVEQKIVVKGTKNAFVIVTHGEACECNVCSTLKSEGITENTGDGCPKVVRFPTDTGCDTLVNHSDDCQCNLCSVLQKNIAEEGMKMNADFGGGTVWASWSKNEVRVPSNRSTESVSHNSDPKKNVKKTFDYNSTSSSEGPKGRHSSKKHCHKKNKEERHTKKKCYCMKCVKRRKLKRLKKRLKHVIGPSDISQVMRELSHHGFTVEQDVDDYSRKWDVDDEENAKVSRTSSKRVSFSSDSKTLIRSVSRALMLPSESQFKNGRRKLLPIAKKDDKEQKRKDTNNGFLSKFLSKSHNRTSSPHSINSIVDDTPCDCIVCNSTHSKNGSQVTVKSKIVHHRSGQEEEQKCFPEKLKASKCGCKKDKSVSESVKTQKELLNKVTHPDDDFIRPPTRCEPSCTGRCRLLTPDDELSRMGTDQITPMVLQAGRDKVPPKVLYWIPSSPNLAAAFSSDSYYIPDMDEFPTSDRDGKRTGARSTAHSSAAHRNQSKASSHPQSASSGRSREVHSPNKIQISSEARSKL